MVRDAVGSMITPEEIEDRLHKWLMSFSLGNEAASMEMKARYPLREASVQVKETPGKPGVYQCLIQLRPHFQLDLVESAFSLTTELVVPQST
jgi:type VI secretion system protein ImpD